MINQCFKICNYFQLTHAKFADDVKKHWNHAFLGKVIII